MAEPPVTPPLWRRRAGMAIFAAFLIALPFVWLPLVGGWFGVVIWACLFLPALLGIVLVQLPLKVVLARRGVREGRVFLTLLIANWAATLGLWQWGSGGLSLQGAAVLTPAALLAAGIWEALDNRALYGRRERYLEWRANA